MTGKGNLGQCWNDEKCQCESKIIRLVKKIVFGILLQVIVKMEYIWQVLWMIQRLCAMKSRKQTLMKRKAPVKRKFDSC